MNEFDCILLFSNILIVPLLLMGTLCGHIINKVYVFFFGCINSYRGYKDSLFLKNKSKNLKINDKA